MVEGNSLRDHVKDAIRESLLDSNIGEDKANEMTYDLADAVFDALAIPPEYQDNSYEHELTELINFYEAREQGGN
jgi:hypothetical protein